MYQLLESSQRDGDKVRSRRLCLILSSHRKGEDRYRPSFVTVSEDREEKIKLARTPLRNMFHIFGLDYMTGEWEGSKKKGSV